jgi:GT2 family glycosyltransferase
LSDRSVTVVIPTLAVDSALVDCVESLKRQTHQDFDVIIVDNSGRQRVRRLGIGGEWVQVIENRTNVGFGAAINQGYRASEAAFIATLNDDATACADWLQNLVAAAQNSPDVGMVASQVRFGTGDRVDSAGMLICGDASSKQRGHGSSPAEHNHMQEVLLPSASAALYRRSMLDEIGAFDELFFLYCEDTDLGLRARWAGWRCLYEPRAVALHRYSHSAGRASALKAFYVERNRLFVLIKNFPMTAVWKAPFVALQRYAWHLRFAMAGTGKAAEFGRHTSPFWLAWFVLRAHAEAFLSLPRLLAQRREIRRTARLSARSFRRLLVRHSMSAKEIASL